MPLQIIEDTALEEILNSSELAADVRASVHGGDCRHCSRPIPPNSPARLVAQHSPIGSITMVWAQHAACGAPTTAEPGHDSLLMMLTPHTYSFQMFQTQLPVTEPGGFLRRKKTRHVPLVGMLMHPTIDGAIVTALDDGSMPATQLEGYRAKGWSSMEQEATTTPPQGTRAILEGRELTLIMNFTPHTIELRRGEANALRAAGALHLFLTFHADPATLDAQQIHALAGSEEAVMAYLPLETPTQN